MIDIKYVMKNRLTKKEPDFDIKKLNPDEKQKILQYMRSVEFNCVGGRIFDCKTKKMLKDEELGFEKAGYIWTTSDIYHFEKYDAELEEGFYKIVIRA